jgi:hypothetical protein
MKNYECGVTPNSRPKQCPSPPLENDDLNRKKSSPSIRPSWQNVSTKHSEANHEFKSDAGGKSLSQKAKVQLCMRWR